MQCLLKQLSEQLDKILQRAGSILQSFLREYEKKLPLIEELSYDELFSEQEDYNQISTFSLKQIGLSN